MSQIDWKNVEAGVKQYTIYASTLYIVVSTQLADMDW